jgi:hypothetical protein
MDELLKLIEETIDNEMSILKSRDLINEEIRQNDDLIQMNVVNLEEDNPEEDKEIIQVQGYGMVQVGDMKFRIRKMLTESLSNLNDNNFGNLNHHFGLNSVGSSFITTLAKFYESKADYNE